MIDDGIFFDFASSESYARSLRNLRLKLAATASGRNFKVPKDRQSGNMRRYAVAIFDNTGAADIDVLLMGNTFYVLAARMAEQRWFVTTNQNKEFGGINPTSYSTFPFESGYGALGLTPGAGPTSFKLSDSHAHATALKAYMMALATDPTSASALETAGKNAFIYFAVTIGEAARFHSIETLMCGPGLNPRHVLEATLQRWVVDSSVRDAAFPTDRIAVAGVHEKRKSTLFREAYAALCDNPEDDPALKVGARVPTTADLAGTDPIKGQGVRDFLAKTGNFSNIPKKGRISGMQALLDAYFLDRLTAGVIGRMRASFDKLNTKAARKALTAHDFAGLQAK